MEPVAEARDKSRRRRKPALATPFRRRVRFGAAVWLLLAVALAVRLGYVASTPGYAIVHDAHDYDLHARSIAAGEGLARIGSGPGGATAFRPPGYPYFLAGVYAVAGVQRAEDSRRVVAGRIANALVGTAIVALIGLLSAQLWGRRVTLVAMALAAVYVPLVLVGGSLMSEPLVAALLLGALAGARSSTGVRRSATAGRWPPVYSPGWPSSRAPTRWSCWRRWRLRSGTVGRAGPGEPSRRPPRSSRRRR